MSSLSISIFQLLYLLTGAIFGSIIFDNYLAYFFMGDVNDVKIKIYIGYWEENNQHFYYRNDICYFIYFFSQIVICILLIPTSILNIITHCVSSTRIDLYTQIIKFISIVYNFCIVLYSISFIIYKYYIVRYVIEHYSFNSNIQLQSIWIVDIIIIILGFILNTFILIHLSKNEQNDISYIINDIV